MAEENIPQETEQKAVVSSKSHKLKRGPFWMLIGLVVIIGLAALLFVLKKDEPAPTVQPAFTTAPTASIEITDVGFVPSTITVSKDTVVTWKNTDNAGHSVESNPHPEHTDLSGLKSDPIIKDGVYHYKFTKSGKYSYHDEQNLVNSGTVIVK